MSIDPYLQSRLHEVVARALSKGVRIATVETVTGGAVAGWLSEFDPGGACVDRAYVAPGDTAKRDMLDIPDDVLAESGGVTAVLAAFLANTVIAKTDVDIALAWSNLGAEDSPLKGKLFVACVSRSGGRIEFHFDYHRDLDWVHIRDQQIGQAMQILNAMLNDI